MEASRFATFLFAFKHFEALRPTGTDVVSLRGADTQWNPNWKVRIEGDVSLAS